MPQILMPYTVHLDHTLRVTPLNTLFAKGDSAAHRFELTILRAGVQDDLTGCTVFCKFYRMADSTVVSVPGNVEGGKAVVALPAACYDYIGRFALTIAIQNGEEETTVFYGDGYMHGQRADTAISGEYIIYDINTLLEKIAEIDAATQAANTATENANTAASNANTARDAANTAASTANTAANNANTAKDAANAAAGKISNMTVSATPIETGTATAALSTVDEHYHLALGLPKGDTGATPQISVQVQTGAAGSEASVSVSGTAENPVIHLTIPRGDVGDIGALTINGKSPDGSGAVTLTPGDLGAATAGEVSKLKSDKLDKTATAADSAKLGGKAPEYYLQPRNLLDNSDFTNPVNQRNAGTVVNDYIVDRWYGFNTTDGSVSITPDGITATGDGYIQHRLPSGTLKSGVVYTIAVYYSDGSIDVNTNGEYAILDQFDVVNSIKPNGKTIAHIALYEGAYTAETLPPYVPKGYSAELAECQRYYQIIRLYRHLSTIYDNEYRYYGCPLPVKMRAKPAVTIESMEEYKVNSFDKNSLTSYSGESYINFECMAISFMCKSELGTVLSQCYVSTKIACTADL